MNLIPVARPRVILTAASSSQAELTAEPRRRLHLLAIPEASTPPDVDEPSEIDTRLDLVLIPAAATADTDFGFLLHNIRIVRLSTEDGMAVGRENVEAYRRLFQRLQRLIDEGDVRQSAVNAARELLVRCLFSGAIPPRLSWHGGDAVVFMWQHEDVSSLFTISDESFSFLEERQGKITGRKDDIDLLVWQSIFPIRNGKLN